MIMNLPKSRGVLQVYHMPPLGQVTETRSAFGGIDWGLTADIVIPDFYV